jgi:ABC-type multidrug transport system ATPase subunit
MENYIIQTQNLSFQYKDKSVLTNINLQVPEGSIYGFLGINGAGKTTSIKIILGLIKVPDACVFLFGKDINYHHSEILSQIGCLVESPALYKNLSAYDYLRIKQTMLGLDRKMIEWALEIVDLQTVARQTISEFSLGMKQRLGIAWALINDPKLLILDEPTNGLDPVGIKDMRLLIKHLQADLGKTIFVSSHLLSEVEKTATDIGILHKSSLVFQGNEDDLAVTFKNNLSLRTNQPIPTISLLSALGYSVSEVEEEILVEIKDRQDIIKINQLLVENDIEVYQLHTKAFHLEALFMQITKPLTSLVL